MNYKFRAHSVLKQVLISSPLLLRSRNFISKLPLFKSDFELRLIFSEFLEIFDDLEKLNGDR